MADDHAHAAATKLAQHLLRMRIDIRTLAFERAGLVKDRHWAEVYQLLREYEDAQVRDMLSGDRTKAPRDRTQRKRDKQRKRIREATDQVVVEKKRAGEHSGKHPRRTKA